MSILASVLFLLGFGVYAVYKFGQEELDGGKAGGVKLVLIVGGFIAFFALLAEIGTTPGLEMLPGVLALPLLGYIIYLWIVEYPKYKKPQDIFKIMSKIPNPTEEEIREYAESHLEELHLTNADEIFTKGKSSTHNTVEWRIREEKAEEEYNKTHRRY